MACVAVFSEKVVLSFIPFIKTANRARAQSSVPNLSYKAGKQQWKESGERGGESPETFQTVLPEASWTTVPNKTFIRNNAVLYTISRMLPLVM